ncbi:hypothetical protein SYNPS1DRAFT_30524, partial [Syncephalis pseudoplumigaleata]
MRIFSRDPVEVRDLVPPVRMYRKDPRSMMWEAIRAKAEREAAAAAAVAASGDGATTMETDEAAASTSASAAANATATAKPGQRKKKMRPGDSIDTSVIAPYGGAAVNRRNLFKKRTRQVFLSKETSEVREERRRDNYPWCLEDFDGSHAFTGDLMGNQGSTAKYALFFFSEDGFRVVMADKWYRFTPKPKHRILTAEEAEELLQQQKKKENDRWLMHRFGKKDEEGEEGGGAGGSGGTGGGESSSKASEGGAIWRGGGGYRRDTARRGFRTVDRGESSLFTDDEDDEGDYKRKRHHQRGDIDELDFDIDQDFQDDEEGTQDLEQQDEETKEATRRQKDNYRLAEKSDLEEEDADEMDESSKGKQGEKLSSAGKEMRKI